MFTFSLKPELCFILIALVATNVFLLNEDVRVVPAEGRPVLAELPHCDEVGCAGGEAPGGAEQGVAVMLPPVVRETHHDGEMNMAHWLTCSVQRILES